MWLCRLVLLGLLLTAASPVWAQTVFFEGPKTIVVPLEKSSEGKLFVTVLLKGRPHRFNLDTGAGTLIDADLAQELGLPLAQTGETGYGLTGGNVKRVRTTADLQIGALKITGLPLDCLDLKELNRVAAERHLPTFDGIIGADVLDHLKANIDYAEITLKLVRPGG